MDSTQANAMKEFLYYLNGIRHEDINKIPTDLLEFYENHASTDYQCNFDYKQPLNKLKLLKETKGLIAMICLNYWCDTREKKTMLLQKLAQNEDDNQKILREKYNPDDIFKEKN